MNDRCFLCGKRDPEPSGRHIWRFVFPARTKVQGNTIAFALATGDQIWECSNCLVAEFGR